MTQNSNDTTKIKGRKTGFLDKTRDGRWQPVVRFCCGTRKRLEPLPMGTSEAMAREKLAAYQQRIFAEGLTLAISTTLPKSPTVDEWFRAWAEHREDKGHTSVRDDRGRFRLHIAPVIGQKRVTEVSRADIKAIVTRLDTAVRAGELSAKTAKNVWGVVSKMFSDAVASKVTELCMRDDNPARDVEGPDKGTSKAKTYLYPSEFLRLMERDDVPLHWRRRVAVAVYLGVRGGELDALEWSDIDLDRGIINVRRALDRSRENQAKTTKTGDARRFKIEPELMPLLCEMKAEAGGPDASGRLFQGLDHTSYSPRLRTFLLRAGVDRAELHTTDDATIKPIGWHDLRATSATWRAVRGDSAAQIAGALGHRNFQTTMIYIREAQAIAEGFGEVFPVIPLSARGTQALNTRAALYGKNLGKSAASPTGFEPVLQP